MFWSTNQISFVLFGPYSPFTTWTTLGLHPDYTLTRAPHVCQKRLTFTFGSIWATFAIEPLEGHINLVCATRRLKAWSYLLSHDPTGRSHSGFIFTPTKAPAQKPDGQVLHVRTSSDLSRNLLSRFYQRRKTHCRSYKRRENMFDWKQCVCSF